MYAFMFSPKTFLWGRACCCGTNGLLDQPSDKGGRPPIRKCSKCSLGEESLCAMQRQTCSARLAAWLSRWLETGFGHRFAPTLPPDTSTSTLGAWPSCVAGARRVAELPLGTPLDGHSVVNLCPAVSVRCACRAFGSLYCLAGPDSRATTMPRRRNPCPTTTWARVAVFAAAGVRWMFRIGYVPNRQGGWWKSPKTRLICAPRVAQTDATCDENPLLRCRNVGTTTGR